ncbi:heterokaryon incompatibility protein [Hirsutella rhossiliensis]
MAIFSEAPVLTRRASIILIATSSGKRLLMRAQFVESYGNRSRDNIHDISELTFTVDKDNVENALHGAMFFQQPIHILGTENLPGNDGVDLLYVQRQLRKFRLASSTSDSETLTRFVTSSSKTRVPYSLRNTQSLLTSASLQRLQRGGAASELGQTFQDSISTAQALGIQFLWIDLLCIFQDSREDWQRAEMQLSTLLQASLQTTVWLDCRNDLFHLYHDDFWRSAYKAMPLMKRAWVCQALLLAPRILYLDGTQLFWECYDLAADDMGRYPLFRAPCHVYAQFSTSCSRRQSEETLGWSVAKLMEQVFNDRFYGSEPVLNNAMFHDPNHIKRRHGLELAWMAPLHRGFTAKTLVDIVDCTTESPAVRGSLRLAGWLSTAPEYLDQSRLQSIDVSAELLTGYNKKGQFMRLGGVWDGQLDQFSDLQEPYLVRVRSCHG